MVKTESTLTHLIRMCYFYPIIHYTCKWLRWSHKVSEKEEPVLCQNVLKSHHSSIRTTHTLHLCATSTSKWQTTALFVMWLVQVAIWVNHPWVPTHIKPIFQVINIIFNSSNSSLIPNKQIKVKRPSSTQKFQTKTNQIYDKNKFVQLLWKQTQIH